MPYSSLTEFARYALATSAFEGDELAANACLSAAQGTMHGYFRAAGIDLPLPATSVDDSIKMHECWLAGLPYLSGRGFDPTDKDSIVVTNYERAIKWCKDVASHAIIIVPVTDGVEQDGDTSTVSTGAAVVSDMSRGWSV